MVISRTKSPVSPEVIREIFRRAGLGAVEGFRVLGAGEFNSVFAVEAGGVTYALKVGARRDAVQIYERDMMSSEVHWYDLISRQTQIPVPKIFFSDFTKTLLPSDYFIMEYIRGTQKDEMVLTPNQRKQADRAVAQMMAQLHRIRGEQFGYIQNGLHPFWDEALEHILKNLISDARAVNQVLPAAERLLGLIPRYRDILRQAPCRLISFDGWDPNFIWVNGDPDNPEYVWIDPERCLWGDPLMDFVTMDFGNWKLSQKTEVLASYNAHAEFPVSGTRGEDIRYAFGVCYLAAIMDCERYYRYSPEYPHWQRNIASARYLSQVGFALLEDNI